MSAAPGDMLIEYLKENGLLFPNVYVISNLYEFDKNGKAIKIQEPIIHTFNKTEVSLKEYPVYKEIKPRTNVILLGDSVRDIGMIEGFPYKTLLKIGFLNENVEQDLADFKKNFDIILLNDIDMDYVNHLAKEIFEIK
jgi:5'-nucleotidase